MKTVSLAITHHNRLPLVMECFKQVINDPRISEIVISDDCSDDSSYESLYTHFHNHAKVRLFRNVSNVDCYRNKVLAVGRATNPWVILFDSDNVITSEYLDALFELDWSQNTVYTPEFAKPHFDFRAFAGLKVTKQNVAHWMRQKHFSTMLNAANYLVPRDEWCSVYDGTIDPHTSDSIFTMFNWLRTGHVLHVVRGLQYFHRVHEGSHYKKNCHKTGNFAREVEENLLALK